MNAVQSQVCIRVMRRREIKRKVGHLLCVLKEITHSDSADMIDLIETVTDINERSTILRLRAITFNAYNAALNGLISKTPSLLTRYGGSISLIESHFDIELGWLRYVCSKSYTCTSVAYAESSEPELDPEYNVHVVKYEPFARKQHSAATGNLQHVLNGCKVNAPLKTGKGYVIIYGYFDPDIYHIVSSTLPVYKQLRTFVSVHKSKFAQLWIHSLTLRDIVVSTYDELVTQLTNAEKYAGQLANRSLQENQKSFNNSSIHKQRYVLVSLLAYSPDSCKVAHALLESIRPQSDAEVMVSSLGVLRKKLDITVRGIAAERTRLSSSYDDITYNTKISLLQVEDYVKTKALEKLKEASSGRESGTKAQQYIDG